MHYGLSEVLVCLLGFFNNFFLFNDESEHNKKRLTLKVATIHVSMQNTKVIKIEMLSLKKRSRLLDLSGKSYFHLMILRLLVIFPFNLKENVMA